MYDERVDMNISDDTWRVSTETSARFTPVCILPSSPRILTADDVRVQEVDRLPAKSTQSSPSGKQIIDFGQNLTGYVRVRVSGKEREQDSSYS
jgi:alpha-L-rhamnosidase